MGCWKNVFHILSYRPDDVTFLNLQNATKQTRTVAASQFSISTITTDFGL
jgi:hypothetical protein